jgi:hypothetical protein
MIVLGNIPVIEIGDAQVEKNVEKEREIEYDKVKPIISHPYYVLYIPVYPENEYGFN